MQLLNNELIYRDNYEKIYKISYKKLLAISTKDLRTQIQSSRLVILLKINHDMLQFVQT